VLGAIPPPDIDDVGEKRAVRGLVTRKRVE